MDPTLELAPSPIVKHARGQYTWERAGHVGTRAPLCAQAVCRRSTPAAGQQASPGRRPPLATPSPFHALGKRAQVTAPSPGG